MALDRIDFPTTPNPVAGDWAKIVSLVSKGFQNINSPLQVDGSNIPSGATFQIGGIIYYGTSDTAISGTASDYIKIEPNSGDSGATALASFVNSLAGVSWNKVYNGYYDGDGNLYVFDEVKAILAGHLSGSYSKFSELWNVHLGQNLRTTDNVEFNKVTTETVNTGHGDNELYPMDQDVRTTASPTFAAIKTNNVNVKHKLFTGTLDSNGNKTFSSGITANKVLTIEALYYTGAVWAPVDVAKIYSSDNNIGLEAPQTFAANKSYRCLLIYEA